MLKNMATAIQLLYLVSFLDLLAVFLIIPLMIPHVRDLGADHIYVGVFSSIYGCFQFVSGPLIGSLSDLKGRKMVLLICVLFCSVVYTLIGFANSLIVLLVLRSILGIFKQTQMLSRALVPDYALDNCVQGEVFGKMAAISGAGTTIGPIIGGHYIEANPENGFQVLAITVGVLFLVNAVIISFLPRPCSKKAKRQVNCPQVNLFQFLVDSLKQSFFNLSGIKWNLYWDVFLFKGLLGFAMGVYYSNYSIYLKTEYELSSKYIGYIIAFQGVIGTLTSYYVNIINSFYINDHDFSQRNFHVFLLITLSLGGMIASHKFHNVQLYVACQAPMAIGNTLGRLSTLEMILRRCPRNLPHRGSLIGASNSVRSLMGVVAPLVVGIISQYVGINYVIYASLVPTAVGAIMSFLIQGKIKND